MSHVRSESADNQTWHGTSDSLNACRLAVKGRLYLPVSMEMFNRDGEKCPSNIWSLDYWGQAPQSQDEGTVYVVFPDRLGAGSYD